MIRITFEINICEIVTSMTCTREEFREVAHEIMLDGSIINIKEVR